MKWIGKESRQPFYLSSSPHSSFLVVSFLSLLQPPTQPEVRGSRLHSVMDNETEKGEGIHPKSTLILSTLAY